MLAAALAIVVALTCGSSSSDDGYFVPRRPDFLTTESWAGHAQTVLSTVRWPWWPAAARPALPGMPVGSQTARRRSRASGRGASSGGTGGACSAARGAGAYSGAGARAWRQEEAAQGLRQRSAGSGAADVGRSRTRPTSPACTGPTTTARSVPACTSSTRAHPRPRIAGWHSAKAGDG